MFLKDNLVCEILKKKDDLTLEYLQELAGRREFPQFEVRTVGSKGELQIKFPHKGWVKPREWAMNHTNTIVKEMYAAIERASKLTGIDDKLESLGYVPEAKLQEVEAEVMAKADQEVKSKIDEQRKEIIQSTEEIMKRSHFSWSQIRPELDNVRADLEKRMKAGEHVNLNTVFNELYKMYNNLEN